MSKNKKHQTVSTYKNPDKYIERLKSELYCKQSSINRCHNTIEEKNKEIEKLKTARDGEYWFQYANCASISVNLVTDDAISMVKRFNVGTKVVCFGEVVEILQNKKEKKYTSQIEIKTVHAVVK